MMNMEVINCESNQGQPFRRGAFKSREDAAEAFTHLGKYHWKKDKELSLYYYRQAVLSCNDPSESSMSSAEVDFTVGQCYIEGRGVGIDREVAALFYQEAANHNHTEAQLRLGNCCFSGAGVECDMKKARRLFRMAAAAGNKEAAERLEFVERVLTMHPNMLENIRIAEFGNATYQWICGKKFLFGDSEDKVERDQAEAVRYLTMSASQKYADAQYLLGYCHQHRGNGVAVNRPEARRWHRLAADQGVAEAQYCLAMMLRNGEGGDVDLVESVRFLTKAAAQHHQKAERALGMSYFEWRGVDWDPALAVRLLRKAASEGDVDAQTVMAACSLETTPTNEGGPVCTNL